MTKAVFFPGLFFSFFSFRLVGHLTYLPHREKGYGSRIGPVFSTSRDDCKSLLVESIPMRLVQDVQRGEIGSFFIWDKKQEGGA